MAVSRSQGEGTASLRVLIVSHYFWPEPFRINQVVDDLVAAGADVTVLTGQPNYPGGQVFAGYRGGDAGIERHPRGYDIVRVPIVARRSGRAFRLMANYLSFIATAIPFGTWMLRGRRFDVVFVYCTTPPIQGYVALWFGWIKRAPVVQWVQDLWPESLSATGFVTSPAILAPVRWLIGAMYRASDLLLGQSHAFVRHIGVQAGATPVRYFPNPGEHPATGDGESPTMGDGFNVVFAGNMGKAQAMETVVAAADLLRDDPEIRITLFGSGAMAEWIAREIDARGLTNLRLGGRVPPSAMPGIYAQASVLLLTLVDDPMLAQTVPSKLQSYLGAGRPIAVAVNGEAAEIVVEAGAGLACAAEDAPALAAALRRLKAMPEAERAAMGAAACRFFAQRYEPDALAAHLLAELAALARVPTMER